MTLASKKKPNAVTLYLAAIVVMFIVSLGGVLLINFGLSFIYEMPPSISNLDEIRRTRSVAANENLDWRTGMDVYEDCKSTGCRPFINPAEKDVDLQPVRPVSVRPNSRLVYCNEVGVWKFIDSDLFGFNNRDASRFAVADLILLGDSFGTAACIDDKDGIAGRLEDAGLNVLNLSVGGHQPLDELAVLKEYAPKHRTLIWLFFEGNDAAKATDHDQMMPYLNPGYRQNLKDKTAEIELAFDRLERAYVAQTNASVSTRNRRMQFIRTLRASISETVFNHFAPTIALFRSYSDRPIPFDAALYGRILIEGKRFAEAAGAQQFIVCYLPSWERYVWRPASHPYLKAMDDLRSSVREQAERAGFVFLDSTEAIGSRPRARMFPYDTHAHYTAEGYGVVASALRDALNRASPTQ